MSREDKGMFAVIIGDLIGALGFGLGDGNLNWAVAIGLIAMACGLTALNTKP